MTQSTLQTLLAAAPVCALVVMLVTRVRAWLAAVIAVALALALFPVFPLTASALSQQVGSMATSVISVVFIMLGGVVMSQMLEVSGAQERISSWLSGATRSPARTILLLGLGVAPLAESVIGFGVGVVTTVPLLLRAGLTPTRAATISLLGIMLAPWGSMGPGLIISSGISGLDTTVLGTWSAALNLPVQLVMGLAILFVGVGRKRAVRSLPELLVVTVVMWLTLLAVNVWVTPALAGIAASVVAIAALILFARFSGVTPPRVDAATWRAFAPYTVLIGSMLLIVAITSVVDLGAWEEPITSPGLWIMVTTALTPLILRMSVIDTEFTLRRGIRMWFPACSVTVLFIVFGSLLTANGMSAALAGAASGLGPAFLVLLPVVGGLAGYVTNSNSASSALLTSGIAHTTHALHADLALAMSVQNVATGAAIMTCPARVTLAQSVANGSAAGSAGAPARVDTGWALRVVLLANVAVLVILTPVAAWLLL